MQCKGCGANIAQSSMRCCYCGSVAQGAFTSQHRNNPNQQNLNHVRPTHAVPTNNFGNHFNTNNNVSNINNVNQAGQNAMRQRQQRKSRMTGAVVSVIGVVIFLIIFFPSVFSCRPYSIVGEPPTAQQLVGTWNLTATRYRGGGTISSSSGSWIRNFNIVFNADGTFTELNYWNENSVLSGNWQLNGHDLGMTRTGGTVGQYVFVPDRQVGLSGNTLTITYTRTQGGNTWHYRHTYTRE